MGDWEDMCDTFNLPFDSDTGDVVDFFTAYDDVDEKRNYHSEGSVFFKNLQEVKNYSMKNPGYRFVKNPDGPGYIIKDTNNTSHFSKIKSATSKRTKGVSNRTGRNKEDQINAHIWKDLETGLTWCICDYSFKCKRKGDTDRKIRELNSYNHSNCNDWRLPSLRELKSISTNTPSNPKGLYIKPELASYVDSEYYWSNVPTPKTSNVSMYTDGYFWDFKKNWPEAQDYDDRRKNGEGGYRHHWGVGIIGVRGSLPPYSKWVSRLSKWADDNRLVDFPLLEKDIIKLEKLVVPKVIIPMEICNLVNLKSLKVEVINKEASFIFSMNNLEELVSESVFPFYEIKPIEKIPTSIGEMTKLKKLTLSDMEMDMEYLPESIGNLINLSELKLSDIKLKSLPSSIDKLTNLESFFLILSGITELPDSIGNLPKLKKISLSRNPLNSLPNSLCRLANLQQLDLYDSNVEFLPKNIGNLIRIEKMSLTNNPLITLPDSIGSLTNLKELNVSKTSLKYLPDSIFNLTNLTHLNISNTSIKFLSKNIGKLQNLISLDISHTNITVLPNELCECRNLKFLVMTELSGKLQYVPKKILDGKISIEGVGSIWIKRTFKPDEFGWRRVVEDLD